MATVLYIGTGLFSDANWALCDGTSENDSEAAAVNVTTSVQASSAFAPGAITVEGIALRLHNRPAASTGTITAELFNSSDTVSVASVTINASDLDDATSLDLNAVQGGWIFFRFGSPQLLLAAKNYTVRLSSSVNNNAQFTSSGGTNWARQLVTTTLQNVGSGDKMIVCGARTGAGGGNLTAAAVTMDSTSSATTYGTTAFLYSLSVSHGGSFILGLSASTNYAFKVAGKIAVFAGGVIEFGTSSGRLPATSTFILDLAVSSDGNCSIEVRGSGIFRVGGQVQSNYLTYLTVDRSAGNTVIPVDSTAGWANGDEIGLAPTTRTASQTEVRTISTVDSGVQVTVSSGLTNARSGTDPTRAEVVNLTRNIIIRGASTSLRFWFRSWYASVVDCSGCTFRYVGNSFGQNAEFYLNPVTGSARLDDCVIRDCFTSCVHTIQASVNHVHVNRTIFYECASPMTFQGATPGSDHTFDDVVIMGQRGGFGVTINTSNKLWEFSGLRIASNGQVGLFYSGGASGGLFADFDIHSCAATAIICSGGAGALHPDLVMRDFKVWRINGSGIELSIDMVGALIEDWELFGCAGQSFFYNFNKASGKFLVRNCVSSGDSSFATDFGVHFSGNGRGCQFDNCTFGVATGIKVAHATRDINWNADLCIEALFQNCLFSSTNKFATVQLKPGSSIAAMRYQQTNGSHRNQLAYGLLQTDTAISHDASPSERLTPNNALRKVESSPKIVAVDATDVIEISAWVRKSVSGDPGGANYNGNPPRLLLKANAAIGIDDDIVLDSMAAAGGTWEELSGISPTSLIDDGVLEFLVDCDGTAGWINIDDWPNEV